MSGVWLLHNCSHIYKVYRWIRSITLIISVIRWVFISSFNYFFTSQLFPIAIISNEVIFIYIVMGLSLFSLMGWNVPPFRSAINCFTYNVGCSSGIISELTPFCELCQQQRILFQIKSIPNVRSQIFFSSEIFNYIHVVWIVTDILAYFSFLVLTFNLLFQLDMQNRTHSISDWDPLMQGFEWTPVIEPQHPGAFITENMYAAVNEGRMHKVPLLMGVASEEMLDRAACKFIQRYHYPLYIQISISQSTNMCTL